MRAFVLGFLLCSTAVGAATLELEVAPGYAWSPDVDAPSAILRVRAGVDVGWFTPSVELFTALFQNPGPPSDGNQDGGLRAWGVAAQARFHTPGRHQFVAGAGAGWGQLIVLQPQYGSLAYLGHPAPYVQAFAGYRAVLGRWRLGLVLALDGFNRVDLRTDFTNPPCGNSSYTYQCPTGTTMWLRSLALTFAFDLP